MQIFKGAKTSFTDSGAGTLYDCPHASEATQKNDDKYRKTSNISGTESHKFIDSRFVL